MAPHNYDPKSIHAVLARLEEKLDNALKTQDEQKISIRKLWAAHYKLVGRVMFISGGISGLAWLVQVLTSHHGN